MILLILIFFDIFKAIVSSSITGPVFLKQPRSQVDFLNNEGATVNCSAYGIPDPKINWYRVEDGFDRKLIEDIPSLIQIYRNGTLVLHSFPIEQYRQEIHASIYVCSASNSHGSIISPPVSVRATTEQQQQQFQAQVYDEYVISGNTAVLVCHIPAFHKEYMEVIAWIREDNKVIRPTDAIEDMFINNNGNLHIRHIRPSKNLQLGFWCKVRNKLTRKTYLSQTAGRIKLSEPQGGVQPSVTDSLNTLTVKKDSKTQLDCAAQGYPPPDYKWLSDASGQVVSNSSVLVIEQTEKAGTFFYSCQVTNKFGKDSKKFKIIIRSPLEAFIHPNQQTVDSGNEFKLECRINGHPIDKIKWTLNGDPVSKFQTIRNVSNSKIKIKAARREHEGMYQCFVSNNWERIQTAAQVTLGDVPPILVEKFQTKKLQPGPSISLKCTATGRPTPKITWKLRGRILSSNNKFIIIEDEVQNGRIRSKVVVKNIRSEDGGEYTCEASNDNKVDIHSEIINIYGLPKVQKMKDAQVIAGDDAIIKCYVSGYPIREIKWEKVKPNEAMPESSSWDKQGILSIKKISVEDEGTYSCSATNGQSQKSSEDIFIKVLVKPELHLSAPPQALSEGKSVLMTCNVISGSDPLKITWKVNNSTIDFGKGVEITSTKLYSLLQIRRIEWKHRGKYSCIAENDAGTTIQAIVLRVKVAPKWKPVPSNVFTAVGKDIVLQCNAIGEPKPKIKWLWITGGLSKKIENSTRYLIFDNGTLQISEVSSEDEGKYQCIASNGVKPDKKRKIELIIEDHLEISKISEKKSVRLNEYLKLECWIKRLENVTITWSKKGRKLRSNKRITVSTRRLPKYIKSVISIEKMSVNDLGEYKCEASTQFQMKQSSTYVTILGITNNATLQSFGKITESTEIISEVTTKSYELISRQPSVISIFTKPYTHSIRKKPEMSDGMKSYEDTHKKKTGKNTKSMINVKESTGRKENHSNLENLFNMDNALMFILPAVVVVILLLAIVITLAIYLLTKKNNHNDENDVRSNEDNYGRNMAKDDFSTPRSTIDRRYGQVRFPGNGTLQRDSGTYNNYEIPNYCVGNQPYSTLQFPRRNNSLPVQTNRESQCSV